MQTTVNKSNMLFCDYYKQWISVYKEGAIRPVTMNKYNMAHNWLIKLIPDLIISDLDRITYQKLLNDYAAEHERQTTMDFHHHLKWITTHSCITLALCWGIYCKCCPKTRSFKHHHYTKDLSSHHPRARE